MTRQPKPRGLSDEEALEALVADGLASRGELLPTTDAEVERAERAGVEFEGELPAGLRDYAPPIERTQPDAPPPSSRTAPVASVHRLPARKSYASHLLAAALGAAAAAALFLARGPRETPSGGMPSSEPPSAPSRDAAPEEKFVIGPVRRCSPCCAGSECKEAPADAKQCSSGRSCIACSSGDLLASRYRVRVGALAPTEGGKALLDSAKAKGFDICVRVGSSPFACGPAHAQGDGDRQWTLLPLVPSAQDALSGVELEVRYRGAQKALGRWQSPVPINATVLCKGLFVKPKNDAGDTLGVVSVFLDDAHFVELMRSERVEELVHYRRRFQLSDVPPKIYETTKTGNQRFALVLGPIDQPSAERLRWAVLEKGGSARLVEGADHTGDPRPLD
jgi:hypothetical protein